MVIDRPALVPGVNAHAERRQAGTPLVNDGPLTLTEEELGANRSDFYTD